MAVILLFDVQKNFREKLEKVLMERQDFIIRTRFSRVDTLPALLLNLLYRKLSIATLQDYDLRDWTDEKGCVSIRGTYEGH